MKYIETREMQNAINRMFDVCGEINYILESIQMKNKLTEKDEIELKLLEHLRNVANRGLAGAYSDRFDIH